MAEKLHDAEKIEVQHWPLLARPSHCVRRNWCESVFRQNICVPVMLFGVVDGVILPLTKKLSNKQRTPRSSL